MKTEKKCVDPFFVRVWEDYSVSEWDEFDYWSDEYEP